MKSLFIVLAVSAGVAAGAAQAQSDVLKAKGCLGCHDMDKKKVGPSFKDIAAKYKGDKAQVGPIVTKMKEGKGHPKSAVAEADLKVAVEQVIATK